MDRRKDKKRQQWQEHAQTERLQDRDSQTDKQTERWVERLTKERSVIEKHLNKSVNKVSCEQIDRPAGTLYKVDNDGSTDGLPDIGRNWDWPRQAWFDNYNVFDRPVLAVPLPRKILILGGVIASPV